MVLFGRKTFDSLKNKELTNRLTLVITKGLYLNYSKINVSRVIIFPYIGNVIELAKLYKVDNLFIAGGAEIYRYFINIIDFIYVTEIQTKIDISKIKNKEDLHYFPQIDNIKYEICNHKIIKPVDDTKPAEVYFTYKKRQDIEYNCLML
jgi:dihydrofolate reductase